MLGLTLALGLGCAHAAPARGPAASSTRLISAEPEAETASRTEKRPDVFVRTDQFEDHVPKVVSKGEAGPLSLLGGRAQLFGDEAGSKGVEVDNFILFEVVDASGKVGSRFAVGYHPGVEVEGQEVDNVGRNSFTLDPGLDITDKLPGDAPFTLRATALDYGGVGRVSDVFLKISPRESATPTDDELKSR
jgi:hypothetical protein